MDLSSLFVSNARKVKFEVTCVLHDLANLPYVSGLYFAKWKLKHGGSAAGSSQRESVKEHVVTWNAAFSMEVTMVIGKDGVLLPCELLLYIKQLVNAGRSTEDVGMVAVNLAEYASARTTTRRYLLQEARVNSILKVTIEMRLIKGEQSFKTPPPSVQDISMEGIRGIFADDNQDDRPGLTLSRLAGDGGDDFRLSRTQSLFGPPADDPNVDFVHQIFEAQRAQTEERIDKRGT